MLVRVRAASQGISPRIAYAGIAAALLALLAIVLMAAKPAVTNTPGTTGAGIKYQFGEETEVRRLAPTAMKWQDGSAIHLGYRVTLRWFLLPYAISANGYALAVDGRSDVVALDDAQISSLQKDGLLPSELPRFSLSFADRVLGHLLWIFAAPWLAWLGLASLGGIGRRSPRPAPTSAAFAKPAGATVAPLTPPAQPAIVIPAPAAPKSASTSMVAPAHEPEFAKQLPVARIKCRVKTLKVAA